MILRKTFVKGRELMQQMLEIVSSAFVLGDERNFHGLDNVVGQP
jgi:hypothetical protein